MIEVAIVEDENRIRESLMVLLNGTPNFSCKYAYSCGEDAIYDIPNHQIDVVLMDIHLPGISGIDCIENLKLLCPNTNFLICTTFDDHENIFSALKKGANGYLLKTSSPNKLIESIEDIYQGGSPMSSSIARKVVENFSKRNLHPDYELLSTREKEILGLLSSGFRYKEIGNKLFISTETVRTHIRNIYEKIQVNSKTDALNKIYGKK